MIGSWAFLNLAIPAFQALPVQGSKLSHLLHGSVISVSMQTNTQVKSLVCKL